MSPLPVPDGNAMVSPDWYEGYEQGTRDAQQQEIERARERLASQPPSGDQMTDAEKIEQAYRRGWDDGILVGRASQPPSGDAPTDDHDHHFDKRCETCKYLAAPSGDAPDLREALEWIAAKADSFCADCDGNRVEEACLGSVHLITDKADAALAASAPSSPATPTVEVNVTVNDQNVVAIGNEIRVMAPWMSENEVRVWADRIAGVVKP